MKRLVLAALLLPAPALAQGPDCGSATPIAGTGAHAFDLTGRAPAGPVGGGPCVVDTGPFNGDVFWSWTCTTAGDFQFEIDSPRSTDLVLYEGQGCGALKRSISAGYTYFAVVPDRLPGDVILLHLWQHVNSPDATGTLTVSAFSDACSTAVDDVFEDNDRLDSAVPISPGSYTGLYVWRWDEDYFRVQVPPNETLRVDLNGASPGVEMWRYDAACGAPATNWAAPWTNTTGATVEMILNFRMRYVGADCSTYDFDVSVAPNPCLVGGDDAFEPNDSCAAPSPITVGTYRDIVTRDTNDDYYSIVVAPGDRLDVLPYTNAVEVSMYDSNCTFIPDGGLGHYTNYTATPETIVFRLTPDPFWGSPCNVHDLTVGMAPSPCASATDDPFEDNDTLPAAAPIGDGDYLDLFVSRHDPDFYSTCVAPGATFEAEINFPDNIVVLELQLYNAPGVQYETTFDSVRATFTNTSGTTLSIGIGVGVAPILADCFSYDLHVSGSTGCPPPATEFCLPGGVNSTGGRTTLAASPTTVGSGLHLEAVGGPPGQFGYFLVSAGWIEPGGQVGDGRLCLTNPVGRYNGMDGGAVTRSVGVFDSSGRLTNVSGTSTTGTGFDVPGYVPGIGAVIAPGETWAFQLWHRDQNPGPTSNFSTGLAAGF